jgi:hypothetical protein
MPASSTGLSACRNHTIRLAVHHLQDPAHPMSEGYWARRLGMLALRTNHRSHLFD